MEAQEDDLPDYRSPDGTVIEPNAVLDTNVMLAIFSWHDVIDSARQVEERQHPPDLRHPDVQFRTQRARTAFLLSLFLDERAWTTSMPRSEFLRILLSRANPDSAHHRIKSLFPTIYTNFVREFVLTRWVAGGVAADDATLRGNDVDILCVKRAAKYRVPLVSWEGVSHTGAIDGSKLIPRESAKQNVDLITPEDLLLRERFDPTSAIARFFSAWDASTPAFIAEHGNLGTDDTGYSAFEYARLYFWRMATDDW